MTVQFSDATYENVINISFTEIELSSDIRVWMDMADGGTFYHDVHDITEVLIAQG